MILYTLNTTRVLYIYIIMCSLTHILYKFIYERIFVYDIKYVLANKFLQIFITFSSIIDHTF